MYAFLLWLKNWIYKPGVFARQPHAKKSAVNRETARQEYYKLIEDAVSENKAFIWIDGDGAISVGFMVPVSFLGNMFCTSNGPDDMYDFLTMQRYMHFGKRLEYNDTLLRLLAYMTPERRYGDWQNLVAMLDEPPIERVLKYGDIVKTLAKNGFYDHDFYTNVYNYIETEDEQNDRVSA